MNYHNIAIQLGHNKEVFRSLLGSVEKSQYLWKPAPDKWCLLEVICHLYDEERYDFKARVQHVLQSPEKEMPAIDPQGWVEAHRYMAQDYDIVLHAFLVERGRSQNYLNSLVMPQWENVHNHPKLGAVTAGFFLNNWLAHDYLHIRQIIALKYQYFLSNSKEKLNYAGDW